MNLPFPADRIVSEFAKRITGIYPGNIEGIYITGSLPLRDFHSNKSDIDFVVLCKTLPDEKAAVRLKEIHRDISKRYPKPDLSGCYLASESLLSHHPEKIKVLAWQEGKMIYRNFEMVLVTLSELKANALTVLGKKAEELPVSVNQSDLCRFLYKNINSYWKNWINSHSKCLNKKLLLLLFPKMTEWSVLGVARQLYTLQTGKITSKTGAGNYCLEHLPANFQPVLREALEIRNDNRTYPLIRTFQIKPSFRRTRETIDCVNYIIDEFNKEYKLKSHKLG
jgi:hypothetical protein